MNKLLIVIAILFLQACKQNQFEEKLKNTTDKTEHYGVAYIKLKDGTDCVALYSNGISCNWK